MLLETCQELGAELQDDDSGAVRHDAAGVGRPSSGPLQDRPGYL